MCNKAINTSSSAIQFVPECCKAQEMWDKVGSIEPFMLKYYPDRYKTQEVCD